MKNTVKDESKIKVKFSFVKRNYYRIREETGEEFGEVKGTKNLRQFKSWFNLMQHRPHDLRYGVITMSDGLNWERWLWQKPVKTERGTIGGWQIVKRWKSKSDALLAIEKAMNVDFIMAGSKGWQG